MHVWMKEFNTDIKVYYPDPDCVSSQLDSAGKSGCCVGYTKKRFAGNGVLKCAVTEMHY